MSDKNNKKPLRRSAFSGTAEAIIQSLERHHNATPTLDKPLILYKCPDCGITWDAQPRHCIPRPNPVRHPDWCYFGPESLARQRSADRVLKEMLEEKSQSEVNLKGQAIREALIKFGWTPPAVEDHEIIPPSVQTAREWNPQ